LSLKAQDNIVLNGVGVPANAVNHIVTAVM
jgi:hypothetical protein